MALTGDDPYWRGYIWININYLALRALHRLNTGTQDHTLTFPNACGQLQPVQVITQNRMAVVA